jgi:hypothetical protein
MADSVKWVEQTFSGIGFFSQHSPAVGYNWAKIVSYLFPCDLQGCQDQKILNQPLSI